MKHESSARVTASLMTRALRVSALQNFPVDENLFIVAVRTTTVIPSSMASIRASGESWSTDAQRITHGMTQTTAAASRPKGARQRGVRLRQVGRRATRTHRPVFQKGGGWERDERKGHVCGKGLRIGRHEFPFAEPIGGWKVGRPVDGILGDHVEAKIAHGECLKSSVMARIGQEVSFLVGGGLFSFGWTRQASPVKKFKLHYWYW